MIPIKNIRFQGDDVTGEIRGKRYRIGFIVRVDEGHHYIELHPFIVASIERVNGVERISYSAERIPNWVYRDVKEWVEESNETI